jgi:ClpP class serine protease
MQPLAVAESWLKQAAEIARTSSPEALLAYDGKPKEGTSHVQLRGDVAIVGISGPLFTKDSIWSWFFGGSSYQALRHDLESAFTDPNVKSLILNFDSPGGEVFGCDELAEALFAMRGKKKIIGYAGGQCDSGAYWLASQCDEIVAAATAELGSIGVRTMMVDDSARDAAAGIKEYHIVAAQSPLKVADASVAADRGRVQAEMTAFAQVFIAAVARGRGVSPARVMAKFGQGDVFVGQDAVDRGLADRIGSLEGVIAELSAASASASTAKAKKKGKPMADKTPTATEAGKAQASMKDSKCSKCDRDMDDDDDLYCAACMGPDKDASAIHALLGVGDAKSAIGAIVALKEKAGAVDALKAELATLKADAQKTEITTLIDTAVRDGRVKPAKRASVESLAAEHGVKALTALLDNLTPSAAPAVPASDEEARKNALAHASTAAGAESTAGMTADQIKILKTVGLSPDKFAQAKAEYRAIVNPADEENN